MSSNEWSQINWLEDIGLLETCWIIRRRAKRTFSEYLTMINNTDAMIRTKVFKNLYLRDKIKRREDIDVLNVDCEYYVPARIYEKLGLYDTMRFTLFR